MWWKKLERVSSPSKDVAMKKDWNGVQSKSIDGVMKIAQKTVQGVQSKSMNKAFWIELLHQATFTPEDLTPETFYTRSLLDKRLLHQTTFTSKSFTPDTIYTRKTFAPEAFTSGAITTLTETSFTPDTAYPRSLLHQKPFYTRHPFEKYLSN